MTDSIHSRRHTGSHALRSVTLAAAVLAGAGLPAQAQFYAYGGAVSSGPVDLFPFDVNVALQDFLGNTLYVGNGAVGSFSALAGAQLSLAALSVANGATGSGTVVFDGAQVRVGGTTNRLEIGNWGGGSLLVSGGTLLDATVNANDCAAANAWCNNFIGNAAGSTGSLTINGNGSEVRTLRSFVLGGAAVFDNTFGTTGGTTHANLNISAGGLLRSEGGTIGAGPGGANPSGNEHSITQVLIDGPGSQWIVTPDRFNAGSSAYLAAATHGNAQATIDLSNGGQLLIDSSGTGTATGFDLGSGGQATLAIVSGGKLTLTGAVDPAANYMNIGLGAGANGHATITGAGSEIAVGGIRGNLQVGTDGGSGQLDLVDGGQLRSGGLTVGRRGGTGSVNVDGGSALLNGGDGRLIVGEVGIGTLVVSNGGLVDATLDPAHCIGLWCGNGVANRAGTSGTLTITGAGSEVRTLRNFWIGDVYLDQFSGTPGGTSTGTVNILAGGTLRTEGATLGSGAGAPLALGTEKSFATVLIDGPGSKWIVTRNKVDNSGAALMGVGGHANATADVTVSGGGLLRIDGAGGAGPNSGINIGSSGKGTLIVTGAGSALETAGLGAFINVGANNAAGDGSFQLLAGGTASSLFFNVGRNGGKGDLLIDGAGSQLTLSGVNTDAGSPGSAGGSIGRNGGTGSVTVSNGGRFLITDGGMDSRPIGSLGFNVGRDAGGSGALTITGAGSTVEIVSTSLALPAGTPDNFNPFVAIGRDNPATASGTLMISDGGKLILTGNAVSTVANGRQTTLHIGGRQGTAGNGSATVTGPGSEIAINGFDGLINVGRSAGGNGVLNVLNQGKVSSTSLVIGAETSGTVSANNGRIALSGHRTDASAVGAGTTIGRGVGGIGVLNMTNGAVLSIEPSVLAGGMSIGGDQFLTGGSGSVSLDGGSSITIGDLVAGNRLYVGRNGNGSLSLAGASVVDAGPRAEARIGADVGGIGNLNVSGASQFRAGMIGIGGYDESLALGTGAASFSGAGTLLDAYGAGLIVVGLGGNGSLSVTDQVTVKGTLLVGGGGATGSAAITLNNATVNLSGQVNDPSVAVAGAGLFLGFSNGVGTANIAGGTKVTMTNYGALGANLALGGFLDPGVGPGTGTLVVSGGSQIRLVAAPGLARVRIGHDGSGVATFSGASLLDAGDGQVIIAGEPGSTGILTLNSGSVLNAGYVGVGSKPGGIDGGTGTLIVDSGAVVNTPTLEIGTLGFLRGDEGVVNGHIINRGTIAPGHSPGRIIVNGGVQMVAGSQLVLDVAANGSGGYDVDHLVLTQGSTYDFAHAKVTFNFIGATDPNAFAASGQFDLDTFLQTRVGGVGGVDSGLSQDFQPGTTWEGLFASAQFAATSTAYDVTGLSLVPNNTGTFDFTAAPVPEPASWLLGLAGQADDHFGAHRGSPEKGKRRRRRC